MDLQETLKIGRRFYRDHNLDNWRQALPKDIRLEQPGESIIAEASTLGFIRAFAFPRFDVQMSDFDRLVDETSRKPAGCLADNQQYLEQPVLADTWSKTPNGKVLQRANNLDVRTQGAYVLLFAGEPNQNAWGRTGKQIGELFQRKSWRGFTVPEYLVLQRYYCERFGDHRFFEESTERGHWLWLVDSMDDSACSVAMANSRAVNIQACPLGNRDSRRGAVPGLLLPLALG